MFRAHCKIAALPQTVRAEINQKLRDGSQYDTIRQWLYTQKADRDIPELRLKTGEPYSLAWTRAARSESMARASCRAAIGRWFHSHYQDWLSEQTTRDEFLHLVEQVERLGCDASKQGRPDAVQGVNLMIRSLLFEALQRIRKGDNNPVVLARLSHAWARMNQSRTETEKLKLQTQSAIDVGLQALYDEMKDNPEAVEQFKKLREIVKRPPKRPS